MVSCWVLAWWLILDPYKPMECQGLFVAVGSPKSQLIVGFGGRWFGIWFRVALSNNPLHIGVIPGTALLLLIVVSKGTESPHDTWREFIILGDYSELWHGVVLTDLSTLNDWIVFIWGMRIWSLSVDTGKVKMITWKMIFTWKILVTWLGWLGDPFKG